MTAGFKLRVWRAVNWCSPRRRSILRRWRNAIADDVAIYEKFGLFRPDCCDHGVGLDTWCEVCHDTYAGGGGE